MKAPIYTLPHGIEVIGEYRPNSKCPYWRVRIRPHSFFTVGIKNGGMDVPRSRAVMSSVVGRKLLRSERVLHKNEDRADDRPNNLELQSPATPGGSVLSPYGPKWRGDGYVGHNVGGKTKLEHVLVAERVLGKPLPPGTQVHHLDQDRSNNTPTNLVICPDQAYHGLLHRRMDAMDACGNPNWMPCRLCKRYDDPAAMYAYPNGAGAYHRHCSASYARAYLAIKRGVNPSHLEPVTKSVNFLRGISQCRSNLSKTHCQNGHAFDSENTYMRPDGSRGCRACNAIATARYRSKKNDPQRGMT